MLTAKLLGLGVIIPVTGLLTVSFFVLFALRKLEGSALKVFGYVITALLWLSALLAFSCGVYTLSTGKCPIMVGIHQMKMKMCPMMKGGMMPPMMQGEGMKPGMGCMKQGKPEDQVMKH